ncbi:MAG: GGDEF and EAL domain-containing protein [Rhizobiaceae bacterium]|nr:GGDEF and EAL domain-containing protein [Rhizobiaceae bacterium]
MNPIPSEFSDLELNEARVSLSPEELRARYRARDDETRRSEARKGLWIAVTVYLLFAFPDMLLIPDVAKYTIAARFAIGTLVLAVMELQFRWKIQTSWLDLTCALALVSGYLVWLLPAMGTTYTYTFSYYMIFGSIFMMGANLFFSLQFLISVVSSGVILLIFLVAMFDFSNDWTYRLTMVIFYVSCYTFTSHVNLKLNRERYNVFLKALEAEARQNEAIERGKALLRLSRTDSLTGLKNRRAIDESLRDYWRAWKQSGRNFAAILIDVDHFKKFNDYYGHQEGDGCLVFVADALSNALKGHEATIGRYGGEEFLVLARARSRKQIADLCEIMRRAVEDMGLVHEKRHDGSSVVTVSIGAAFTRKQIGTKFEKIIHEADRALYLAKAHGRNCARLFDPNDLEFGEESEDIALWLKIALSQDLVSLVYQPILDIRTGRIEAAEALMRLKAPDGSSISPNLFVPIAERTGAIIELGRWAIEQACNEMLVEDRIDLVTVNVSPIQLKAAGFAQSVATILSETGVSGKRLAFEITEGLDLERQPEIAECISDLRALGINIWLDDFGTGFASLSWLRLIDFDTVKIDRSFLHDAALPRGRAMFQDMISLVRNHGHNILIEGVETEEQMTLLRKLGIDKAQGFLVGRPAPARTFPARNPVQPEVPARRLA